MIAGAQFGAPTRDVARTGVTTMATREELISGVEMLIREGRRLATDLGPQQWDQVVDLDGWKNKEVLAHVASIGSLVPQMASGFAGAGPGTDAMASIDIDQLNA